MEPLPRHLPEWRDRTLAVLAKPGQPVQVTDIAARIGGGHTEVDRIVHALRAAQLYWVAPDMAALAVSAGAQLAAASWDTGSRPSGCGLIFFAGGVGQVQVGRVQVPVEAVSWGPHPEGMAAMLWLSRRTYEAELRHRGAWDRLQDVATPALLPVGGTVLPARQDLPFAQVGDGATVLSVVAAAWLLMGQTTLAERTQRRPSSADRASARRLGVDPVVSVVDLRRQYRPNDREESGEEGGRRFRRRWVVSGHWRDQAHGPDRTLRRRTWIAAYVKGPDGAPLLATERVNVWRR